MTATRGRGGNSPSGDSDNSLGRHGCSGLEKSIAQNLRALLSVVAVSRAGFFIQDSLMEDTESKLTSQCNCSACVWDVLLVF